jgi:hypothetical protein
MFDSALLCVRGGGWHMLPRCDHSGSCSMVWHECCIQFTGLFAMSLLPGVCQLSAGMGRGVA